MNTLSTNRIVLMEKLDEYPDEMLIELSKALYKVMKYRGIFDD